MISETPYSEVPVLSNQQVRPIILVIDHDEAVRKIVHADLQEAGYDVLPAAGGKEAMSAAAAKRPSVLITEMFMPQMDGFELIQHFRAAIPGLKIIVMSEIDRVMYLDAALRLGADFVLLKPLQRDKLLEAIRRALAQR